MGPNDVDIVRVFARKAGGVTAESALPYDTDFEVVVEVEAGGAIFSTAAEYAVGLVIRDLQDGTFFPTPTPAAAFSEPTLFANDHMQTGQWTTQSQPFVYKVTAPGSTKENHICDILASLRAGHTNPDVEFAQSPLFIIIRP